MGTPKRVLTHAMFFAHIRVRKAPLQQTETEAWVALARASAEQLGPFFQWPVLLRLRPSSQ